ncbi:hypothetical protein K523DRAFT_323267 [Schizophyllum commune Tattone D]|nr:hypothetical protein K523DRAFT_323267 [Schizophyllum commune Tattone D]
MDQAPRRPLAQNTNQRDPQDAQVPNFHHNKCCAAHRPIYATTVRRAGKYNEIQIRISHDAFHVHTGSPHRAY